MESDLVSIIMPTYNSACFVEDAISSVLKQTYSNWELLITDDQSKDNTVSVIRKYASLDKRIKVFVNTKNIGAALTRNNSISNARGRFIAFLDSDDWWVLDKLEIQISFMKSNNIGFCYSSYETATENGIKTGKTIHSKKEIGYKQYLRNTLIGCLTVVLDRLIVGEFEMPNIRSSHDMALWLDIMKRGHKAHGIDQSLAVYRLVSSSNTAKKWKAAKDVWYVYRKHERLNIAYSAINFSGYSLNAILKRI